MPSIVLPPLGNGAAVARCLKWDEPEVIAHVTMDAVSETRPAKAECPPALDAEWSDSTCRCGAHLFLGQDERRASGRTTLGNRPTTPGQDLHLVHGSQTALAGFSSKARSANIALTHALHRLRILWKGRADHAMRSTPIHATISIGDRSMGCYASIPTPRPILALRRSCPVTE